MTETEAAVSTRRRISAVWIVPVVAMLLGVWLVVNAYLNKGPVVEIDFPTAEGIEEDTTPVKARNVEVGRVTDISLNEDLSGVIVTTELAAEARQLLREDTQFWVVRPRVSSTGISGLGTIVSGAYIEVAPGAGAPAERTRFQGFDHAPPTPAGAPGLRINLTSETSGSLGVGDPVLYRGYPVGRVEDARLDVDAQEVRYSAFIDAPYDTLVTSSTRFWNASGISAELTAQGATLTVGSLETLIAGGVAFDLPEAAAPGAAVPANETFQLYPDRASIDHNPHRYHQDYVVSFNQSVRGLGVAAPVTFRGITIGSVQRIMVGEGTAGALGDGRGTAIPVLIRLEPGRLEYEDSRAGVRRLRETVALAVESGLRGALETGNLLTGSLYINLDFFDHAAPGDLQEFDGYPAIPTVSTGLGLLQQQVSELMAKLNGLPLDESVASANAAIAEFHSAASELHALLASDPVRGLPGRLDDSLAELNRTLAAYSADSGLPDRLTRAVTELSRTLESVRAVADTLERNPNAMLYPTRHAEDPQPGAGAP
jgi:paraquat-inducible protein B